MFSVEERDRVRARVLELADVDPRVVAGAAVGSLANGGGGDRFSDLDLTFGVDGAEPVAVLDDWTGVLADELRAAHLFDLPAGVSLYRVFLLPGALQVDLSCTPAAAFGPAGPRWELLFGEAIERPPAQPPDPRELLGLGVHHAVRARFCVERGRTWQAEHWIAAVREHALALACRRRGLPASHGRGLDELPAEVLDGFADAFVRSLEREELLRALGRAVDGLLREAEEARDLAAQVEPELRALTSPGWS